MESRGKRFAWDDNSVSILLKIWEDNIENLRAAKRNSHVYRKMRNKMIDSKIRCDVSDISNKIKNLSQKYRSEKKLQDFGGIPSDWKWFKAVEQILTGPPSERNVSFKEESIDILTKEEQYDSIDIMNKVRPFDTHFSEEPIKSEVLSSCESVRSVSLPPSPVLAATSLSPDGKIPQLAHIYQEMLDEMKQIKKIEEERSKREEKYYKLSTEYMRQSLKNQEEANKFSDHSIYLARENLQIQKLILKQILKK